MSGTQKIRSLFRSLIKHWPASVFKWLSLQLIHLSTHMHAFTGSQTAVQTQLVCSTLWKLAYSNKIELFFFAAHFVCVSVTWVACRFCSDAWPSTFPQQTPNTGPSFLVAVCVCDAQCGPYSAAREVVTCGVLNCGPEMGPWQLYGGVPHANSNYSEGRDVSFGKNVWYCCMKLLVLNRKNARLLWEFICIYVYCIVVLTWRL